MTPRNKAINKTIFESFLISIILVDGALETSFIVFFIVGRKASFSATSTLTWGLMGDTFALEFAVKFFWIILLLKFTIMNSKKAW